MARRIVRKTIPRNNPDKLIRIARKLIDKHQKMGEDSPLQKFDMELFEDNLTHAVESREQSQTLRSESEALMQRSKQYLGTDIGQNRHSADTVYNFVALCRDQLCIDYSGNEEQLTIWGFDIVVSSVVPHGKKKKKEGGTNEVTNS